MTKKKDRRISKVIKIILLILVVIIIMLIPGKALAGDSPDITISSSNYTVYDGETVKLTIKIKT